MSIDGDQGYPCEWFLSPVRFIWETNKQTKLNFNFQVVISCREILGQGWCLFQHLSVLGPYLGQTHAGLCSCCHCECELICSSLVLCLEVLDSLLSFIPSVSYTLLLSLTEFFETRGEASGRDNIQDWVFHSLSFFFAYFLVVGLCSHQLQEETFMMMVGKRHLALYLAFCSYCCVPLLNCNIWLSHRSSGYLVSGS